MHRIWLVLLLTGCPPADEVTTTDVDYDFFSGEDVEWRWGTPNCVVYMRDMSQRAAQARWFAGGQLVAGGPLSAGTPTTGGSQTGGFRRGFYLDGGKLAIEDRGANMKRFYYDEKQRLSEIVERRGLGGRALKTSIVYDASNRMIERYTERESMFPLVERWKYGSIGGVESYVAELNGRNDKIFVVERKPSYQLAAVRTWGNNGTWIHEFDYANSRVSHVNYYYLGAMSGRDFFYEYDDKNRIVARTIAPFQTDEAGSRTELVYGEKDVVERRELTANGLLRSRAVYERDPNGDVRIRTDSNADGEFDQLVDLRDECYGGPFVPEFAAIFSPRITIEGEPPYRVDP